MFRRRDCGSLGCDTTESKFLSTRIECCWTGAPPGAFGDEGRCHARQQAVVISSGGKGMGEEVFWRFGGFTSKLKFRRG